MTSSVARRRTYALRWVERQRRRLHPSVRIVVLVVMAVAMTGGGWGAVMISGLCLGLAPAGFGGALADLARVAWRLRYLLASIVFFYGWFSGADTGWWPDLQGLGEGARRALILMVMALGARRFLGGLRRERAAAGLFWLLAPLQHLRLPVRSFATRLVLVFDCLSELGSLPRPAAEGSRLRRVAVAVAAPLDHALHRAEHDPLPSLRMPRTRSPRPGQWLVPSVILGALFLI
ncbi:hypothetical protein [Arhodomonas sp. SL1]|uniref:hypothetical protein n=1 Tax=Arhodomonas sp. SL1 TaxID=3425691 RepID=UPI003F883B58